MARSKKTPPPPLAPATADLVAEVEAGVEAGAGAPQELLPEAVRSEIVVHEPVMTPLARMIFTDWNTNAQSAETFNELLADIRSDGFTGAVEVVPFTGDDGQESYLVVSGEWRCKAARTLGIPAIPASILRHKKFAQRDFQMVLSLRRNNIHGAHDKNKLRQVVAELATKYPNSEELRKVLAFTKADEWRRLVGQTREGLKKQGATPEMMQAFEEKAKNASSLADLSVIVSRLFELYKDTVPYGFMVFTYGRKEHLYVAGTKGTMRAITRIAEACARRKVDINSLLGPALTQIADRLDAAGEGPAPKLQDSAREEDPEGSDVPF